MPVSKSVEERVDDLCNRANDEVAKDVFEKAKKLYEEALQLGESIMEPEMRIGVREALAECYRRLKDFKQAADCNREALRLLEGEWSDQYGYQHRLAVRARRDLATNLSNLSDQSGAPLNVLKEAVELRVKNIEILRTNNKPKTLADAQHKVLLDIVKLQSARPSGADADKLFRQASSLYEELFSAWRKASEPADSLRFIEARHNYGVVLYELGNYAVAKKVFLENQAILDDLSEAKKKRFQELEQNADRYLASCIEKTNDLSLGITRRCTGSLEDKQERKDSKQESTPAVKVDAPEKSSKSSNISRDQSRNRKDTPSVPGAFPDGETKHSATNGKLSPSPEDTSNRGRSRSGSRQEDQAADRSNEKPKASNDRQTKHNEKESTSKRENAGSTEKKKTNATNDSSHSNLKPNDDGGLTRSRSDPDKKKLLEPEKPRKSHSRSDAGIETPESDQKSDVSSVPDGELFSVPESANDADVWMIRMRKYAHTLLKYRESGFNRKRVRVAIVDSGVQRGSDRSSNRSDIWRRRSRFKDFKDFTGEGADWTDSSKESHGTNCASLVLQVAPESDIYVANVVRRGRDGIEPKHVAEALKWAINDKKVDIISLSLGWDEWKHSIAEQINEARQKHILIFAAASNNGRFKPDYGSYPAWEPTVFCINASTGSGVKWDRNPLHSDDKVNLMFLGKDIAVLGSNNKPESAGDERLTGTSFATPIAAATAALVLDLVRWQASNYPKVERCLKTYEGMSAVFQAMSGKSTKDGYYHVMPWNMLGKDKKPISLVGDNESDEWFSLVEVCKHLRRFGDASEKLD